MDTLLTQRVRDHLTAELQGEVEQVRARHILVRTEDEARQVLQRLQNGERFADVAADVSIDLTTREQGGDLGWFTRDELLDPRLAEAAFNLQPNEITGPIATRIGYHILQTLEKGVRPVEPERMTMIQENLYLNWLAEQIRSANIERYQ